MVRLCDGLRGPGRSRLLSCLCSLRAWFFYALFFVSLFAWCPGCALLFSPCLVISIASLSVSVFCVPVFVALSSPSLSLAPLPPLPFTPQRAH